MELKSDTVKSSRYESKNICRTCLKLDSESENIYNQTNEQILKELRSFVEVEVCFDFFYLHFSVYKFQLI